MIQVQTPQGWKQKPLKRVAEIERQGIQPDQISSDAHYVGLEHVDGEGNFIGVQNAQSAELKSTKFSFSDQHILYGKLRPYLRKISRPEFSGVCSTDILPIRPQNGLDRDYLFHYLRQQRLVDFATARCTGINLPRLSPKALAEFPVIYPDSLDEQKRIAAILDKADAIRRKRRQALGLADQLLQSTFLSMVGPKHPEYSGWPEQTIESLAETPVRQSMRTGPFGSALKHSEFVDEGIAVLGIDNAVQNRFAWGERRFITEEKYDDLKRYTVKPNDVIITIMGTTGRSAVVPDPIPTAISTKHLATISLDKGKAHPEFISNAIHRHPAILKQIGNANRGAIMSGLNLGIIKSLELRVPPLPLQLQFASAVQAIRDLEERMESTWSRPNELFESLTQRAFRGEL
ncbi:restriction endonuclease subunit S [Magnetofaba australis]|uniref:Putative restriction modification system DNA specificity subunit n=1 Tax=Magnetofaba australis IT-1 TaxID=1434232 RepID=A0A1Y2KC37_9PROT|nr:restriction endonuclease subunit S [Magnetofaba australis]OSM07695.1 putative restriction modification system DNA specificity subunit [Magnetofaba australis IT-1]